MAQLAQVPHVDARTDAQLLVGDAARLQLEQDVVAVRAGALQAVQELLVGAADVGLGVELARAQRLAEPWPNVRPMAITSPTDFMCVESVVSTPGNFSNANRGHLTTT